ncbi:MAG TPA: DUF6526 family protein [Bryobacteraceae bacterium]|nr:DUF6526 family protein [Bryobacteraceae bacterium]
MATQHVQNYANHTRLDPPFHMFVLPVAAINILAAIWNLVRSPGMGSAWLVVLALAGAVAVVKIRTYALKVQDRVIRLEERLRLSQLLAEPLRDRIGDLTEAQLIALRFASDAEVPALVEKALDGTMLPRELKQAVVNWRADYFRV